jgi:hypothetical protein
MGQANVYQTGSEPIFLKTWDKPMYIKRKLAHFFLQTWDNPMYIKQGVSHYFTKMGQPNVYQTGN